MTFDVSILANLIGDNEALIKELISDYLISLAEVVPNIIEAHARGELGEVGQCAHRLNSSSKMVGAPDFGEICEQLENACKEQDAGAVTLYMEKFLSHSELVKSAMTQFVSLGTTST